MSRARRISTLAPVAAGFALATALYGLMFQTGLSVMETLAGAGASTLVFWIAIQLREFAPGHEAPWVLVIEQFCLGTGLNLVLHALITYGFGIRRTPFLVVAGGLFASLFLVAGRRLAPGKQASRDRVLLLGFDSTAPDLAASLGAELAGVVAPGSPEPDLPEIVRRTGANRVIVAMDDWESQLSVSSLLHLRGSGVVLEESALAYERLFRRVCSRRLNPADLLISAALRGDARTMAIQAIYTNLLGLTSLIVLSPLLLLGTLAIVFLGGPGPILESVECAGFQYIPFHLLRFRTTSTVGDERRTLAGRLISRLGIVNLPQLINIVRGDMALVGPRPTRRAFAHYLTRIMPFYAHRFSVKPGIVGWAQVNAPRGRSEAIPAAEAIPEVCRDIEYDLFYIKAGSLWMDIEILADALLGSSRRPRATV